MEPEDYEEITYYRKSTKWELRLSSKTWQERHFLRCEVEKANGRLKWKINCEDGHRYFLK